jgi:hypothetical protein
LRVIMAIPPLHTPSCIWFSAFSSTMALTNSSPSLHHQFKSSLSDISISNFLMASRSWTTSKTQRAHTKKFHRNQRVENYIICPHKFRAPIAWHTPISKKPTALFSTLRLRYVDWSPRITRSLHNLAADQPHSQRQKFSFLLLREMLSTGCLNDQWMLSDDFPNGCHPHLISSQLYKVSSEGYFPREVWCSALRDSLCKHVLKVTLQAIWWEKLLSKRDLVFCVERFSLPACAESCICKGFDVLHW